MMIGLGKNSTHVGGRFWRSLSATAVITVVIAATSCTPNQLPVGDWLDAGCYKQNMQGVSGMDMRYSGFQDQHGNVELPGFWVGRAWNSSSDGSCSGPEVIVLTLVRSTDVQAALDTCHELGHTSTELPTRPVDFGYEMPNDAWVCAFEQSDSVPI